MKMYKVKVLIVGAGQLGSRHLQSLSDLPKSSVISVVDPSLESLHLARERYDEVIKFESTEDVEYCTAYSELKNTDFDVCVVATGASNRFEIIKSVMQSCSVRHFILEKVLFQSSELVDQASSFFDSSTSSFWVNCPRRVFPVYKNIISLLAGQRNIHMNVSGIDWGLACNSIHFIDLWSAISRELNHQVKLNVPSGACVEGKRPGYKEFYGEVSGFSADSSFSLKCLPEGVVGGALLVQVTTDEYEIEVNETTRICTITKDGSLIRSDEIVMPYQSELTSGLIMNLIESGSCTLTPYHESAVLHKPMLLSFLKFFNQSLSTDITECPIT